MKSFDLLIKKSILENVAIKIIRKNDYDFLQFSTLQLFGDIARFCSDKIDDIEIFHKKIDCLKVTFKRTFTHYTNRLLLIYEKSTS